MLRISAVAENATDVTLKLEGRLADEWVTELEAECRRWLARQRHVRLDLGNVTGLDGRGRSALRQAIANGTSVVNCPALLQELLAGA